jgi:hypothetical protein
LKTALADTPIEVAAGEDAVAELRRFPAIWLLNAVTALRGFAQRSAR